MKTMTLEEYHDALRAQGVGGFAKVCMVCPMCGTLQNASDLVKAGAGRSFEAVEPYLGFSCVGRWTHHSPPPKQKGTQEGCNWTLGGLLRLHELEVITPDGEHHPRFDVASPEAAREHVAKQDSDGKAVGA